VRLTRRQLNRTLLRRQHLLHRVDGTPEGLARHLIGFQAQENLPPYLSLHARLTSFDPHAVTRGLDDRSLVRLLAMRGTIHLLTRDDALSLRRWTQVVQERELRSSQNVKDALGVDRDAFATAVSEVLDGPPLPQRELSARLAERFPDVPPAALGQLARVALPLAQVPPRGGWGASGGVVYQYVDRWVGEPMHDPDVDDVVRRYLAAYGPATAADVTAWSGVTRLGPVLAAMDDLVRHEDENGKVLLDVADAPIEDEDAPAPPRLLGTYDNVWLSHAGRDRVTEPEKRTQWMGANGGVAMSLFVDGWLEGLWRQVDGRVEIIGTFRDLTRRERADLDEEIARTETMLAR
jgi:Winged helix DNA-binding domain